MFKIVSAIVYTLVAFAIFILAWGYRAGYEINTEFRAQLPYEQNYLFSIITDIEKYPDRKNKLRTLEVLERKGVDIIKWKEIYNNGSWREYELLELREPYLFRYSITDSNNDIETEVEYYLEEGDEFTTIYLKENGEIKNTWNRGWRKITSDSYYLKREIKWLRVAILDEQLGRQ